MYLRKLDAAPCAEWHIALLPRSMLFSGFLHSVAFFPQAFRSQSIGFHCSRRNPSPTLLCAGAVRIGQLFSIPTSSADSHSELSISTNAE